MHRMMGPIPLFQSSRSNSARSTAFGQSVALSSKEKKYMSNVEKALQSFESVDEWADYIAFLVKLQKALLSNPNKDITNWIPFDFQVSITLSKCISPSLPSGVHKKTIEIFNTIFDILKTENMSQSVSLWLPAILPLMSYASISIKQDLLDFYNNYICKIQPNILKSCFKSILLSLLPALDDTTSEFFDSSLKLIDSLKDQLNDTNHFWQSMFLSIITSPDKRIGAMEYLTRKLPSFIINADEHEISKENVLSLLTLDGVACVTPNSGLLIKSFCKAMTDENLFVQRGFFDLLLSKLPLNSLIFEYLIDENDKILLFLYVTSTVLKKDMSLNRRLWNWLLGPENPENTKHLSRLEYFMKYGHSHLLNSLSNLVENKESKNSTDLINDYIKICNISTSIMDRWEIGQSILPNLFVPILEVSKYINDNYPLEFDNVIKYSNELFDGIETNVIWSNILKLIKKDKIDLVLFILKHYNVEDEDMMITHIPLVLLSSFALFKYDNNWIMLIESLMKIIPSRALLPLDLCNEKFKSIDYYTDDLNVNIITELDKYYSQSTKINEIDNEIRRPFTNTDFPVLYLNFTYKILLKSFNDFDSIFLSCTKIFDDLIQLIPTSTNDEFIDVTSLTNSIKNLKINDIKIELSFGISHVLKYLIKNLSKLEVLKLLKITSESLWNCLKFSDGKYQVEIVKKFWSLEVIVGSSYLEATLCDLLLEESNFENRIFYFNIFWVHLNNDNYHEFKSILNRPLYIILEEIKNDVYLKSINKWILTVNNSGTLNKIFKIISLELFNNEFLDESFNLDEININRIDFNKISYDLEIIFNLLNLNDIILNSFKLELCVIDNNKQIDFIKSRNWDISTYKSFMLIVLTKFLEIETTTELIKFNDVYLNYIKCIRLSLKLINLLIDENEINFNDIFISLVGNCEENCLINYENSKRSIIISYYLETISKLIKLSSKKTHGIQIFDLKSINLLDFLTIGIKSSDSSIEFNNWIELILSISEYYPDIIFQISNGLIDCICCKIETEYLSKISTNINLINESVCELILGIEKTLMKCHKHLGYILSDTFGFTNLNNLNNQNNKESGFFGSVIQGVFQVETTNDKNEGTKRKRYLIESFRRSIFTIYQLWIKTDNNVLVNDNGDKLNDLKTRNFCFNKIKFRCKKIVEQIYFMEPLETIESLIECYEENEFKNSGFKLFQVLDDCKQKIIMSYILDSIISRVNYGSLEEDRRSSLISKLDEFKLSVFLIEYTEKLNNDENLEQVWNDIQNFLKDSFSNPSYYKYIYSNLLRFVCIIGIKLQNTNIGKMKKGNKDVGETFIKMLNLCITIKIAQNQNINSFSNIILNNSIESGKDKEIENDIENRKQNNSTENNDEDGNNNSNNNSNIYKEKTVFREDVCIALIKVIPYMKIIINDNDKLISLFTNIINGINGYINKNGSINFNLLPKYIIKLLIVLSEDDTCKELKIWKNFCFEMLNDSNFFKINENQFSKWNLIMKNWIMKDENRLNDIVNSKLIFSNSSTNSGPSIFNWNDEVDILNANIPMIKILIYLIIINEKDTLINLISNLKFKIDEFFKTVRQMNKYCETEKWIMILLRCIILRFNENHLVNLWTLINKSMFYLFNEVYNKLNEINKNGTTEAENEKENEKGNENENEMVFNEVFLQGCKLLDILVILNQEEFQLSEWIFISDSLDGILKISNKNDVEVGIIEKINKNLTVGDSSNINITKKKEDKFKVPLLKGINNINNLAELSYFFNNLKINKYEAEIEMKEIDYESIENDIFNDLFTE
jgi:hypothetical protein